MTDFLKNKLKLVLAVAILAILLLLVATRNERVRVTVAEGLMSDALGPFQSLASGILQGTRRFTGSIVELRNLRQENQRLKAELESRYGLEASLAEVRIENDQLKGQLGLVRAKAFAYLTAKVIGRSPDNWFSTVILDRGSSNGVTRDLPVVTERGLVGRVSKVTARTATVMLLQDRDSGVGAIVQSSRDAGVVLGKNNDALRLQFFSRDARVGLDDQVLTSGLGGVYPKGIPIGRVTAVDREEYGLLKVAQVQPHVDFSRLEWVLIVTDGSHRPEDQP